MNTAGKEFGLRLRGEREHRGIPLDVIAESTKIKPSLLADLERGDVSKWPRGIFRRSFVREYAAAVGLSPDAVVAEFLELFPEDGSAAPRRPAAAGGLRLTLADDPQVRRNTAALQGAVAAGEAGLLLAVASATAWLTPLEAPTVASVMALVYYPLGSAIWGRSPAFTWMHRTRDCMAGVDGARPARGASEWLRQLLAPGAVAGSDAEAPAIPGASPSETFQVASR